MKTIDEFAEEKLRLLIRYDALLASPTLLVDEIELERVRSQRHQLAAERFVVAICGQMKAGKSTLLNALLFGAPVLPQDDTPMTAKNVTIEYGEKPGFEARFYTPEEWQVHKESLRVHDDLWFDFSAEIDLAATRGSYRQSRCRLAAVLR